MLNFNQNDSRFKHLAVAAFAALALVGCGDKKPQPTGTTQYEVAGDHAIGNPNATVTVVEYASVTCGHCANWHMTVFPDFKTKYVDTGKVRYIFREFPTPPENLARAGFLIANCAGEDKFLDNISIQFKRQKALLSAPDVQKAYQDLAKASGLTEQEYMACLVDEAQNARYENVVQGGIDAGVTGTPSFFINGKKEKVYLVEDFDKIIAPLLGEDNPPAAEKQDEHE